MDELAPRLPWYVVLVVAMTRTSLKAEHVASLVWSGDELVDWVGGGQRWSLDGTHTPRYVGYAYCFDAVKSCADVVVIYTRGATKGLVLRAGEVVRELNRSFYQAHRYEYPICLWQREGRVLLAHCPDEYNRLQIEDALTGERLTPRASDTKADDFFHSRLSVSPDGARLLSAGWVWHPWDAVVTYDVSAALRDGAHLDSIAPGTPKAPHVGAIEEASACWQSAQRCIIGTDQWDEQDEELVDAGLDLRPYGLVLYDVAAERVVQTCALERPAGEMMPVGAEHVLCLFEHPRLHRLRDGALIEEWPDLPTGKRVSSIFRGDDAAPAMALDPAHRRIAIHREAEIHILSF